MNHPSENLGVVVRVHSEADKAELEIGLPETEQAPYMQLDIRYCHQIVGMFGLFVFMYVSFRDGAWRSRTKRTTNRVCSEEYDPNTTECCMWPLTIDFEEFGWEWVLFPR